LSGELVARLKSRAKSFLEEAEEASNPDLAVFFVEQAMQLYAKAVLYELFAEQYKGHGLRELLGLLAMRLREAGYGGLAERISSFVGEERAALIEAEEAYILSRYGSIQYTREDALALNRLARRLIKLLDEVVDFVKMG